jgi:hypothetical protein
MGGHLEVVNRLLADPRVDPSDDSNLAIRNAMANNHLPVVERLLQDPRVIVREEVTINGINSLLYCLFDTAVIYNWTDYIPLIFKYVKISAYQINLNISRVIVNGKSEMLKLLLERTDEGIDPFRENNAAYNIAVKKGYGEIIKQLERDPRFIPTKPTKE